MKLPNEMKKTRTISLKSLLFNKMKGNVLRITAAIIVLISAAGILPAQDLRRGEFGIRYMPTFSALDLKASNNDIIDGSASISHGFGVMLGANLSTHFGFQGEVNYYQVSQNFRDQDLNNEIEIRYLNIPLLISLNTSKEKRLNFNVVAGPQFGLNVGASIKSTGTDNPENLEAVVAIKKGDIGMAYGAGVEFALNMNHSVRLDLGYRGFYGLVDLNATNTGEDTYNVIAKASRKTNAVYLGITFLF
ncbi:MAG: PorT family protein [Prolixibacteraceae bacterium]|nr:PorT family protein [Prolixibacteraceae bacterium]